MNSSSRNNLIALRERELRDDHSEKVGYLYGLKEKIENINKKYTEVAVSRRSPGLVRHIESDDE